MRSYGPRFTILSNPILKENQLIIHFDGLVETAIRRAEIEARNNGHNMLGAEYLLLGTLQVEEFRDIPHFGVFGITAAYVSASIRLILPYADESDPVERADCFNQVLTTAEDVAKEFGASLIDSTHFAYGLVCLEEGLAFGMMSKRSVDIPGMRANIRRRLEDAPAVV